MNRNEFLKRLRDGLKGFQAEEIKEILDDYNSHISEAVANGRSEEECIRALGDVNEIVKEYRLNKAVNNYEQNKTPKNFLKMLLVFAGLSFFNLTFLLAPTLAGFGVLLGTLVGGVGLTFGGVFALLYTYVPAVAKLVNDNITVNTGAANPGVVGIACVLGGAVISMIAFKLIKLLGKLVFNYLKMNKKLVVGE